MASIMGAIRYRGNRSIVCVAALMVVVTGVANGFDDFGFTDYSGDGFTIEVPSEYIVEVEENENGTTITRFYWNDAYMRDFRVTVIEQNNASTLAELMFVNEELLNAENRLAPGEVIIGDKRLNKIGADEGYRGEYTVEETAREFFARSTFYLGKDDIKYLLDVSVHTGKLEGGLEIVQRILDSFRLNQ